MQGDELRETLWAPPKDATLLLPAPEPTPEEYGTFQLAGDVGRARSQIAGEANARAARTGSCVVLQEQACG